MEIPEEISRVLKAVEGSDFESPLRKAFESGSYASKYFILQQSNRKFRELINSKVAKSVAKKEKPKDIPQDSKFCLGHKPVNLEYWRAFDLGVTMLQATLILSGIEPLGNPLDGRLLKLVPALGDLCRKFNLKFNRPFQKLPKLPEYVAFAISTGLTTETIESGFSSKPIGVTKIFFNPEFTELSMNGKLEKFSERQGKALKFLFLKGKQKKLPVSKKEVMGEVGDDTSRFSDLFPKEQRTFLQDVGSRNVELKFQIGTFQPSRE